MKIAHKLTGCLIVIATITSMHADPATKMRIAIGTGCAANTPATVFVVLNGNEKFRILATKRGDYWEGETAGYSYNAKKSRASLRGIHPGGGGRSECQKSDAIYLGDQNTATGSFQFDCNDLKTEDVRVVLFPPTIKVGYTRGFALCVDWGFYETGIRQITELWPNETVRIHLDWPKDDHNAPGLILLEPDPKHPERLKFTGIAARHVNKNHEIDFPGLTQALIEQRGRGVGSGPTPSSPAIDIDIKRFQSDGLQKLVIEGVK